MNKKKIFQSFWIDFETRLPPDTDERIIVFINSTGYMGMGIAKSNRKRYTPKTGSKYFWMKAYPPEGMTTNEMLRG